MFITTKELAAQCNGVLEEDVQERALRISTIHSAEALNEDENKGISVFFEFGDMVIHFDILGTTVGQFTAVMNRLNNCNTQEG